MSGAAAAVPWAMPTARPLQVVGSPDAPRRAAPEPLLRRAVGDLLRRERQRQGLSLRQLAARSQVSLAFLSEIERGRKEPSSEVLAAICRALRLPLVDLVAALHEELGGAALALTSQAGPAASRPAPAASRRGAGPGAPVRLAA